MTPGGLGAVLGLTLGVGLLLIMRSRMSRPSKTKTPSRLSTWLGESGIVSITPTTLLWASFGAGVVSALIVLIATTVPIVALLAGVLGAWLPFGLLRRRIHQRRRLIAAAWPDAIDVLVSGIRAGYSLSQALAELGTSGPPPLRPWFIDLDREVRVVGSLDGALERLQVRLADPVADRVVAALRLAHHVGGTDLGFVLRSLSQMLREDARMRGEISARQSWTVNAARLAVAAPWLTLVFLCLRSEAVAAYATIEGAAVLVACAGLTAVAYLMMIRLGRVPGEQRLAS